MELFENTLKPMKRYLRRRDDGAFEQSDDMVAWEAIPEQVQRVVVAYPSVVLPGPDGPEREPVPGAKPIVTRVDVTG